jgi:BlaI family transcriptional regulator, penicillinase repressor
MARPKAKELTERELEIMHVFWEQGELSIADLQAQLAETGRELAYTTVATLVKILHEKSYIKQTNDSRPFRYRPSKSFREVSGKLLKDVLQRVFGGSREALLVRLMEQNELSAKEREVLKRLMKGKQPNPGDDAK